MQSISQSIFKKYAFTLLLTHIGFLTGGIGLIEMLDKSNIFAIVGGGTQPFYSPNSVFHLILSDLLGPYMG